jgi:hypothetical protein
MSEENSASPLAIFCDDEQSLAFRSAYFLPSFVRARLISENSPLEGALEGFVFDVFEARLQRVQQLAILGAGHVGDAVPEVLRLG